jgi:hypothetical protein
MLDLSHGYGKLPRCGISTISSIKLLFTATNRRLKQSSYVASCTFPRPFIACFIRHSCPLTGYNAVINSVFPGGGFMSETASVTLPGRVEKIIPAVHPDEPSKAQIEVEGADHLYREIRIENALKDENGAPVQLKQGAEVDVTIEADPKAVTKQR